MKNQIDTSATSVCAFGNLRRTDLVITQFYDGVLAPSGLYAIQFGVLSTLNRLAPVTINYLAELMDIDRAALTRLLKVLIERDLVCYGKDQDGQANQLLLTEEGQQALKDAWPLWEEAQARIETSFGPGRFKTLLGELAAMRAILSLEVS